MEDPRERLTTAISTAELERRWNAARAVMREHKIDFDADCIRVETEALKP